MGLVKGVMHFLDWLQLRLVPKEKKISLFFYTQDCELLLYFLIKTNGTLKLLITIIMLITSSISLIKEEK